MADAFNRHGIASAAYVSGVDGDRCDTLLADLRSGRLAFLFTVDKFSLSRLKTCLKTAHNFLLSEEEARNIFDKLITTIKEHWGTVCEEAELNKVDKQLLWRRQFLNPYSVEQ